MNGFVIGTKPMTCRSTPMMLSSLFLERNCFDKASVTTRLTLSIFLCGIVIISSGMFQSMPTAWKSCDQVVNFPSCHPSEPNTRL